MISYLVLNLLVVQVHSSFSQLCPQQRPKQIYYKCHELVSYFGDTLRAECLDVRQTGAFPKVTWHRRKNQYSPNKFILLIVLPFSNLGPNERVVMLVRGDQGSCDIYSFHRRVFKCQGGSARRVVRVAVAWSRRYQVEFLRFSNKTVLNDYTFLWIFTSNPTVSSSQTVLVDLQPAQRGRVVLNVQVLNNKNINICRMFAELSLYSRQLERDGRSVIPLESNCQLSGQLSLSAANDSQFTAAMEDLRIFPCPASDDCTVNPSVFSLRQDSVLKTLSKLWNSGISVSEPKTLRSSSRVEVLPASIGVWSSTKSVYSVAILLLCVSALIVTSVLRHKADKLRRIENFPHVNVVTFVPLTGSLSELLNIKLVSDWLSEFSRQQRITCVCRTVAASSLDALVLSESDRVLLVCQSTFPQLPLVIQNQVFLESWRFLLLTSESCEIATSWIDLERISITNDVQFDKEQLSSYFHQSFDDAAIFAF